MRITGAIVAIVTPMLADGQIDYPTFGNLIDFHISEGTDAIVVAGTTGESSTLTVEEQSELIRYAVKHCGKRIPVIAGTGANSTQEAIELSNLAAQSGADAALSVVPYYNRPSQEGLYQHFKLIADKTTLPMILYNVPGRTVADMHNDTVMRLAQIPNIIGIKDATGKLDVATDLVARAPKDFLLLSGDDMSSFATMLLGFHGIISVTANIAPRAVKTLCQAIVNKDLDTARRVHFQLAALNRDLFCEANPIPVKWAAAYLNLCGPTLRLPLSPMAAAYHDRVIDAINAASLQPIKV